MRVREIYDYLIFSDEKKELVIMFENLIKEVYGSLAGDIKDRYKEEVENWIYSTYLNLFLAYNDKNEVIGFAVGEYVENSFCVKHYIGLHCYVKPMFRKTRAAYLLYKAIIDRADKYNLPILVNAFQLNDTKTIMKKLTDRELFKTHVREAKNGNV
ncbi:MAG: GNAT family N-acetyltransferase [Campylobacteraceae bacterium]|jgi:GNAT superfamily N-acetyltransferase|nr:GNAT family N-acetyltransferase [Campylobacteraceae bacterium]